MTYAKTAGTNGAVVGVYGLRTMASTKALLLRSGHGWATQPAARQDL